MSAHVIVSKKHGTFVVLVDDEDDHLMLSLKWAIHLRKDGSVKQAASWENAGSRKDKTKKLVTRQLHRMIMNPPKDMVVDHKNGQTLDNRKENLRVCTQRQNSLNHRVSRSKSSNLPCGVTISVKNGRSCFVARISRDDGERLYLGRFKSRDEAIAARSAAEKVMYGEFSRLSLGSK